MSGVGSRRKDDVTPPEAPSKCWRCRRRADFYCPQERRFDEVEARLKEAGYREHHDEGDARIIGRWDWFICHCGRRLSYVGLKKPGSYRAFAVCPGCGHWIEV